MIKESSLLKIKLLSNGVDFEAEPIGIMKNIKEEYRALFDARLFKEHTQILPPEIILPGNIVTKVIYRPNSKYLVRETKEGPILTDKTGKDIISINFPSRPDYYNKETSSGVPMKQIAQLLGLDCIGIIVNSYCSRGVNNKHCKFCNINSTTGEESDKIRSLEDISETAQSAYNGGAFSLVNLTGGTFKSPEKEFITYLNVAKRIREIMGLQRLPGISSINPPSEDLIDKYEQDIREANYDLVTYNLEVWDKNILREVCPGKHEFGGRERYVDSAIRTIEILGKGHVGIIFTVGPWESIESIVEGSRELAQKGILPIPVVFHPGKGADYSWMGTTSEEKLLKLFREIYYIYKENDLIPTNRTRPAGSEKSFRNSLINESVLGYLN